MHINSSAYSYFVSIYTMSSIGSTAEEAIGTLVMGLLRGVGQVVS